MRRTTLFAGAAVLAVMAFAVGSCGRAESQIPGPDTPRPKSEVLARGAFPDDVSGSLTVKAGDPTQNLKIEDASEVVSVRNTFAPGDSAGWHTHVGPAIVVIASGEFTYVRASDCARFVYKKGQSFVDPGHGSVHIGFNASKGETVLYATFLEVPRGKAPSTPAKAPDC